MSDKVKIYEIAREVGIKSTELVEICQESGFEDITHHSNAVMPEKAEEIRKTAIKKYKPESDSLKSRAVQSKKSMKLMKKRNMIRTMKQKAPLSIIPILQKNSLLND